MSEIRAGGHVIGEHGWIPAELAEEPVAEVDPLDEYATGGGWYEIDGEKYHGKKAALAALE